MIVRGRVLIAIVVAAILLGGFAPSAHALFGRHGSKPPRAMRHSKKNTSPYAYLAPKKQKKASTKSNAHYHRNPSVDEVFGKKKK